MQNLGPPAKGLTSVRDIHLKPQQSLKGTTGTTFRFAKAGI